nr:immunoglobulin light chain junction region [Macaca mulatta]
DYFCLAWDSSLTTYIF